MTLALATTDKKKIKKRVSLMSENVTLKTQEMKDKRLLLIFITVFVDLVGFGIIIPMNPYLAQKFGATPFQVGWLMSIYSLMQFVFAPLWGRLSDRFGRRPILLISLMASSVSHLGFAFADSFLWLFLFRLLAGVGGGNLAVAMAYIADITEKKDRSKGMGLIGAAFGLGFILGPAIGGFLGGVGEGFGHEPPFGGSFPALIASLICFLNMVGAWFYLPETHRLASSSESTTTFYGPLKRLARVFWVSRKSGLGGLYFVYFCSGFALAFIEMPLFLYVELQFGWSLAQASFGFAYIGLWMVLTQGYLIRKFLPLMGEARLMPLGMALLACGLLGCFFAITPYQMAPFITLVAVGYGLANPSITGSISLLSPTELQGENLGVAQSLAALARILGPIGGGWAFQHFSIESPFLFGGLLAFVGFIFCFPLQSQILKKGA